MSDLATERQLEIVFLPKKTPFTLSCSNSVPIVFQNLISNDVNLGETRKKIDAICGGRLETTNATLVIPAGSLVEDTEITMTEHESYPLFERLMDHELVDGALLLEFSPENLIFANCDAELVVKYPQFVSSLEVFVLHGRQVEKEEVAWELLDSDGFVRSDSGPIYINLHSFSYKAVIWAPKTSWARFSSYFFDTFMCRPTLLYRELDKVLEVVLVLVTDYVKGEAKDIKALPNHVNPTLRFQNGGEDVGRRYNVKKKLKVRANFTGTRREAEEFSLKSLSDQDMFDLDEMGFSFRTIEIDDAPLRVKVEIFEGEERLWRFHILQVSTNAAVHFIVTGGLNSRP